MHMFVSPAIWVSFIFLMYLFISKTYEKKNKINVKDKIIGATIAIITLIAGLLLILLLAIMQYDEIAFPQEWWKFAPLGGLAIAIIANALVDLGVISYNPEPL